ncbi:MAG: hypothetical protein ACTSRG_21130 [Candidatus Helarchaeota archaeon]
MAAVAQHLAEATYLMLKKEEVYKKKQIKKPVHPHGNKRDCSHETSTLENWKRNFWGIY